MSRTSHHRRPYRKTGYDHYLNQELINTRTAPSEQDDFTPLQHELDFSLRQHSLEDQIRIISDYSTIYKDWRNSR